MPEPLLITPGQQTRPRRAAIWPADIATGETNSVLRQRIDVRGGNLWIALHAQLAVAEIVGDDDENVGARDAFARRARGGCKSVVPEVCQRGHEQESGSEEERVRFHVIQIP